MAFLDNLSKKASLASSMAIQKTKELTEIAKLNTSISESEKVIRDNYQEIGKRYVELHADDPEAEFKELLEGVVQAQSDIADYRKQIQDIKGIRICENCGAEVQKGVAYCGSCGAQMPIETNAKPEQDVEEAFCVQCGAKLQKDAKFCVVCGTPVAIKEEKSTEESTINEFTDAESFATEKPATETEIPLTENAASVGEATEDNTAE